jgi:ribosomal-protein-alanine N-acetyltransferase
VEGVGEMAGWPHHQDIEMSRRILRDFIVKDEVYALVLKEEDKVIGSLGLHDRRKVSDYPGAVQREIGYVLSQSYWGRGLMPEAVQAAIRYAFEDLGADALWCCHFAHNARSRRVIEKCGFRFYRDSVQEAPLLGKVFDDKIYLITKADYAERG